MMENIQLKAVNINNNVLMNIDIVLEETFEIVRLSVTCDLFQKKIFESTDYFKSLVALRRVLEKSNFLILCMGALKNVHASGMLSQFSRGRRAYLLKLGVNPTKDDVIDIFAPCNTKTSFIDEQSSFYKKWLNN